MECYFCGYSNKQHGKNCPEMADPSQQGAATITWNKGYDDGLHRREASSDDPTYNIGWAKGDSAADYRENVFEEDYYE